MNTGHSTPGSKVSLYIHWPFCAAKCPYCDFNSHVRGRVEQERWRRALLTELARWAALLPGREAESVFFGGGTPSLMEPETARALLLAAAGHWGMAEGAEITLEANPTSAEAEKLAAFRRAGVNRVSLGVQALRDDALRFLGRRHGAAEALAAVRMAGGIFGRMSFDLIYARPGQSVAQWEEELEEALAYAQGHLSLYQLTIEPGTQFYHRFRAGEFALPEEETAAEMFERTQAIMEARGLPAYEISNHAAPGQESRHNLVYWRGGEYAGIGPGAHGRIAGAGGRVATRNIRSPEKWLEQVEALGHGLESQETIGARTALEERLLMGLRLREGVAMSALNGLLAAEKIMRLQRAGLLEDTPDYLRATPAGRLVLDRLTAELL